MQILVNKITVKNISCNSLLTSKNKIKNITKTDHLD